MINGTIVDTTVWIDFLLKKDYPWVRLFAGVIVRNKVTLLPVIMQEILQGVREDEVYAKTKEVLLSYDLLKQDDIETYLEAAVLYRKLRKLGLTIRKPNDCFIASFCIKYNYALLHNDKDFDNIAKHTTLKIYK